MGEVEGRVAVTTEIVTTVIEQLGDILFDTAHQCVGEQGAFVEDVFAQKLLDKVITFLSNRPSVHQLGGLYVEDAFAQR